MARVGRTSAYFGKIELSFRFLQVAASLLSNLIFNKIHSSL